MKYRIANLGSYIKKEEWHIKEHWKKMVTWIQNNSKEREIFGAGCVGELAVHGRFMSQTKSKALEPQPKAISTY